MDPDRHLLLLLSLGRDFHDTIYSGATCPTFALNLRY